MTNTTPEVKNDPVNHPSHYTQYPVEVIELTRHMSFDRGNAVKYIARAGYKGGPAQELEDIKKAIWYLQDDLKQLEKKAEEKKKIQSTFVIPHASVQTLEFKSDLEGSELFFGKPNTVPTYEVKITTDSKAETPKAKG